MFKPSGENI